MTALSLQTLHALGWTLLHFVWQGAALAALLAAALMVSRNANVRYALGIGTLTLMVAAPVVTFAWLNRTPAPTPVVETPVVATSSEVMYTPEAVSPTDPLVHALASGTSREDLMIWLVQAWFVGVMLLFVRTAGGLVWLTRTRRGEIEPLSEEMHRQCLMLQQRMGLQRHIRYGQSRSFDSPVVLGWLQPMVIVTTQALTGLSPQQLQAIIAHELAHIRRHDAFVNVFQVVAEMFLFYHPAVWWVSRRIRIEREVCCDHEALAACGEPVSYARALTMMEEWRAAPAMLMAANRSPLAERVLRLLGTHGTSARSRVAGVGASVLGVAIALFAGSVLVAAAETTDEVTAPELAPPLPPAPAPESAPQLPPAPAPELAPQLSPAPAPELVSEFALEPAAELAPERASDSKPAPALKSAPAPRPASRVQPSLHMQPTLRAQPAPHMQPALRAQPAPRAQAAQLPTPAVPPREPREARTPIEAGAAKTSSYIAGLEAAGLRDLTIEQWIAMKVQGITLDYVERILATQLHPEVDELIAMKVHDVTPEYIEATRRVVADLNIDQVIAMKVHDVTPEYIEAARRVVADLNVDQVIAMKVHDVTPEYIREMQAAGFDIRIADDVIAAKVHAITPELIKKAIEHGFKDLSIQKLMMLRDLDTI